MLIFREVPERRVSVPSTAPSTEVSSSRMELDDKSGRSGIKNKENPLHKHQYLDYIIIVFAICSIFQEKNCKFMHEPFRSYNDFFLE